MSLTTLHPLKPSKGEIEEKKAELAHEWLEQADNAHEAVTETLTYHINAWAPVHGCLVDGDDAELGRIVRQKIEEYAKRCTRSQLENWIEGYDEQS